MSERRNTNIGLAGLSLLFIGTPFDKP